MTREFVIGDKTVALKASGALPIVYRVLTGNDFFKTLNTIGDDFSGVLDIMWVMYRHANPDEKIDEEAWLEQFDFGDLLSVSRDVISMISGDQKTMSEAKKKSRK